MLVVDLLHEFELGVWKAVFLHLLRILQSVNEDLAMELDRRYDHVWRLVSCVVLISIPVLERYRLLEGIQSDDFQETLLQ
jgi:hypothetical protein